MWSFPLIKTAKRWNLEKQRSNTKLQRSVTGRDRVSFLGFGPVVHMPPEHCHSCILHTEMVMKSNSNCCVCLDAISSSTHLHVGNGHFQFTHVLESSHGTLQGLINMWLKWQLECFLHLFNQIFVVFFENVYVYFVCLFIVCYGWMLCSYWLTPAFSRVQSRNLNSHSLVTSWSDQDLSLPCYFCMNYMWLASEGWCTITLY